MRPIDADAITYCTYDLDAYHFFRAVDEEDIAEIPTLTIDDLRPKGRWVPLSADGYADGFPVWDEWECSECQHEHSGDEDTLTNFCPSCGADMRGGGEDS